VVGEVVGGEVGRDGGLVEELGGRGGGDGVDVGECKVDGVVGGEVEVVGDGDELLREGREGVGEVVGVEEVEKRGGLMREDEVWVERGDGWEGEDVVVTWGEEVRG
ncbi:hypothetical protein, partial [Corynebacterium glyciniphilum]|uniref:hypothetical protein n=1 Tax=Corynebacterium glyciniphilum TaxID=1404244 RepID=UPI001C92CC8F